MSAKPIFDLELRPVELELRPVQAPRGASPDARVFVLLPTLEELLGQPGFGRRAPICVPGSGRPYDPVAFFARRPRRDLH